MCTSALLLPPAHTQAQQPVMYTVATPLLKPSMYSLRNKDIKRALKRFLGMTAIMGPIVLGMKKCLWCQGSKPQSQNLLFFFYQILEVELVPSIEFLNFHFFSSIYPFSLSHSPYKAYFCVWHTGSIPFIHFMVSHSFAQPWSKIFGNSHLFHMVAWLSFQMIHIIPFFTKSIVTNSIICKEKTMFDKQTKYIVW